MRFVVWSLCLGVGPLAAEPLKLFDGESTFGWSGGEVKDKALVVMSEAKTHAVLPAGKIWIGYDASEKATIRWGKAETIVEKGVFGKTSLFVTDPAPLVITGTGVKVTMVTYEPTPGTPLFNGKNLDGWKLFPGDKYKSKFTVSPEGTLHVEDGPGDLQTVGKYADFLLQLECRSNGPALNSGIFFRCLPDQYQMGYEMQIQNAFKDNDRTKPADFGTGAIYRRIPARKVVSNDKEWFAMTLLAKGNRLMTWVNGEPVVDWVDDRAADENARKGSKLGAGHLSIQGHDPTTNLDFRNLRIVEIKAP